MNNVQELTASRSKTVERISFPSTDSSRTPFELYTSSEIYELEQERIFRTPTWSFVEMEAELPNPGDFKSTFVGDTPVAAISQLAAGGGFHRRQGAAILARM